MFKTNLSGDNDLPIELDYSKLFEKQNTNNKVTNNNRITIPVEKKEVEKVYINESVEELSDCNSGKWQLGLIASCVAIYFGLPYLFGNK